ncbi:MAG: leucine-rich repeat domain-containing protein [Oscillospiraceae bacterium]|nr:leucine-rich repeat domain-containing protein [Oscillospiraceae bacterium]
MAYAYAIPEGVVRIASRAFYGAPLNLKTVMLPASLTDIGRDVFDFSDDVGIYAPAGSSALRYAQDNGIPYQAR